MRYLLLLSIATLLNLSVCYEKYDPDSQYDVPYNRTIPNQEDYDPTLQGPGIRPWMKSHALGFMYRMKYYIGVGYEKIKKKLFKQVKEPDFPRDPTIIPPDRHYYPVQWYTDPEGIYRCKKCRTGLFIHRNSFKCNPSYRYFFETTNNIIVSPDFNEEEQGRPVSWAKWKRSIGLAFKANYNSKVDHYKAIVDRIEWGNYYGYDHDQAEKAKALYEENDPNYKEE